MAAQIDEKDEPGEYRESVRRNIEQRLGPGTSIPNSVAMVGNWNASFDRSHAQLPPKPFCTYSFQKDGKCTIAVIDSGSPPNKGIWRLNPDGTFSIMHIIPPDSTIPGLASGAIEEERNYAIILANGRCVLWNGDASVVQLLEKVAGQ